MKLKAHKVCTNTHETTIIYIDVKNIDEVLPYIFKNNSITEEFKEIKDILLENLRNKEKYCKVNVSKKAKDMFEMRFTRNGRNDRIYCKEFHEGKKRRIVMIEVYESKKSQDIPSKIVKRIENMGGNEYDFT